MSRLCCVPALLVAVMSMLPAAEGAPSTYSDLRLGFEGVSGFQVEEVSSVGASTTTYRWTGEPQYSYQGVLEGVKGWSNGPHGGPVIGGQFSFGEQRFRPDGFVVGNTEYSNGNDITLSWRQVGLGGLVGWSTLPPVIDSLSTGFELVGFARLSAVQAGTTGTGVSDQSLGWGWDTGLRFGAFVAERQWMLGATATLITGAAQVDLDPAPNTSTTLHLTRHGYGFGMIGGVRF